MHELFRKRCEISKLSENKRGKNMEKAGEKKAYIRRNSSTKDPDERWGEGGGD